MTTDITELAQSLKAAAEKATQGNWRAFQYHDGRCGIGGGHHDEIMVCEHISKERPHDAMFIALANPANILALVEALEKAQAENTAGVAGMAESYEITISMLRSRIAELESRTVKLPDGWQFEECEIEGCENGAIFSVGTGSRNIHLCDKCAHEPQNSRLKKSPLSKRLPFKMSAGIKVEAE
ncbi:ead/Ea22-like family protein [Klebsiella pneumoniae]|uniref:ead/Ea22-like family protein n=1 Tax=Klebsiella pneumoniae TaxID=573 RepID=UPI0025515708|nr:ead/Ea22-like family protein [Klebsiella pneumoniae]MEC5511776.1 ead/Ea22-like family protein [Klebsiella pneumoniae]MEC5599925.1 ead/Ea22-like family protein [Klebsiella pneumoniae]